MTRQALLECARSQPSAERLEGVLSAGFDWDCFLDRARRHNLLPLAYERLRDIDGHLVPPEVMARLKGSFYANALRNARLQAELAEVVTALQAAGIEPIVLKGGALASTVYADPGQRPMADLDLLVRPGEMEPAGSVLSSLGYRMSGGLPAHMVAFQQRFGGGLEWLREQDGQLTRLDLQHDLVGVDLCRHAFAVEPITLWAAARPLDLDEVQALQLSAEDTLIHLCLHPALHHGYASPLSGYVDIDRLVAAEGSDDFWGRLEARAGQVQARTAVYHGLCCAQDLLGTPVPADVLVALAPGALRQRLVAWLAPLDQGRIWARTEKQPSGLHQLLLYAALMERPRDVLYMLWAILFPKPEWLAVRYGLQDERQARRYRLVHPWRVARAFLRGLRKPLTQSGLE